MSILSGVILNLVHNVGLKNVTATVTANINFSLLEIDSMPIDNRVMFIATCNLCGDDSGSESLLFSFPQTFNFTRRETFEGLNRRPNHTISFNSTIASNLLNEDPTPGDAEEIYAKLSLKSNLVEDWFRNETGCICGSSKFKKSNTQIVWLGEEV